MSNRNSFIFYNMFCVFRSISEVNEEIEMNHLKFREFRESKGKLSRFVFASAVDRGHYDTINRAKRSLK